MKYNIAAFTHQGTHRNMNQDRILVQKTIYSEGQHAFQDEPDCFCIVADGIGGGPAGDFAAYFVLNQILTSPGIREDIAPEHLTETFKSINEKLIRVGQDHEQNRGMGTTLVGLITKGSEFRIMNAGDSPAWLLRKQTFFQLTTDHVLNPLEPNSPITSYFGGSRDRLHLQFNDSLREILKGDIIALSSDGLYKGLTQQKVKEVLLSQTSLTEKSECLLKTALDEKTEDDVSCILVEVLS